MQEWALGMPTLHRLRRTAAASEMEETGRRWREEFDR
jgi:ketol-acid reductoisomerase